ncbi:MAG TPA: HD domain-containing phosphohydrolase [Thermodesulfovibrionales bacterium]|nr:HD domain-containing phosphohydrolase [Thermodesulfovibrionales bacterium]
MEKGKILIVDDDPVVRGVLSDILSSIGGFGTDVAVDGLEGIEKVKNNYYDVVFTDLTMPRLNGMDLLKETKRLDPTLPIIVITGFTTIDNAINAMKEGARDFITKPFNVERVTSTAARILGERKLLGKIAQKGDFEASIGRLNAELFRKLQEIALLQTISTELDEIHDNNEMYERVVEMASRLLMAREVSFGIIDNGHLKLKSAIGTTLRDIAYAGTLFEKVVRSKTYSIAPFGEVNPHSGIPLTSPFFSIPFVINDDVFGVLNLSDKADGSAFMDDEIYVGLTFAKKAALRIENNALYEVLYNNLVNNLKSLVISIEARDSYTKQHSERVTDYALQIVEVMNICGEEKDAIQFGGYLHDVGKIGVRDTVLLKPGKLTDEEMEEIKMHPVIGDNIIKPLRFFPKERELILYHHERIDGTGYPHGISGDSIPTTVRILSVADTYDAMTSSRPYRIARTHDFAIEELKRCSGTQFDAEIVHAFMQTKAGRGMTHEG